MPDDEKREKWSVEKPEKGGEANSFDKSCCFLENKREREEQRLQFVRKREREKRN